MNEKSAHKIFITEREGQLHFFKNFGIKLDENDVLIANTDGVYNGNIFEFKLNINNTQQVLFQAIKYLSRLRITGHPVPKNILLVSLNQAKVYVFDSGDYFEEIHQIYYGGASRNNEGFSIKKQPKEFNYSNMVDADKILKLLKENYFTKIKIDENNDRVFRKSFLGYLRRELNGNNVKIMKQCKLVDSQSDVLIQMADMIAGSINRSYNLAKPDRTIYKSIFKKHITDEWQFQ